MLLGEVVFGGLGAGVYSIVMIALVGVFLGGLMVGRTPEYLGKKVGAGETRWIVLYALLTPLVVLVLTGIAVVTDAGLAGLGTNSGPRGFTEILFAYASCMASNGQTMAGLNANTVFYNVTTTIAMLAGRYGLAALALALAGRFAAQRCVPATAGTLPGDTPTFAVIETGRIRGRLSGARRAQAPLLTEQRWRMQVEARRRRALVRAFSVQALSGDRERSCQAVAEHLSSPGKAIS